MVSISDHENEDGTTNWDTYNAAQKVEKEEEVAKGERCKDCDRWVFNLRSGDGPQQCGECRHQDDKEEWDSDTNVRCPKCKDIWDPSANEQYDLMEDGEHTVTCDCDHEFVVRTSVSWNFTSPELIGED